MKINIFIMCSIFLLLYGCGQETTVTHTIQNNIEYQEETFQEAIGKQIGNVENIPTDKKSYLVKAEADGEIYYLKITSKYFLREIRADKEDGEILYQVVY